MEKLITGIHHVTAICSEAQQNLDFYGGVLGLRLVKKTVNFDAQGVYHFYYGDETGRPGSLITFFPYGGLPKGRQGKGSVNTTAFSLSYDSVDYWTDRFKRYQINFKHPQERFKNEVVIYFEDPDGLGLELVFNIQDRRPGFTYGQIPLEHSIKGIYNVEIWLEGYERTAALLTESLGHRLVSESGNRFRFAATSSPGNFVDLICTPDSLRGLSGSGRVHHVAFSTRTKEAQTQIREILTDRMLDPTPILDRQYFRSIYFREPGGVLFEVATTDDLFSKDESSETLGKRLMLPPWLEKDRENIEHNLPKVAFKPEGFS